MAKGSAEYNEGQNACVLGVSTNECPYSDGEQARDWQQGMTDKWEEMKETRKRNEQRENDQKGGFESWGLLELFGHQRLAGKLSEQVVGGIHFLRIDVPAVGDLPTYTRFFTQGAIYSMSPTTEEIARMIATNLNAQPVNVFDLRQPNLQPRLGFEEVDQEQ